MKLAGQNIFEQDFFTASTGKNDARIFSNPPTYTNSPDKIVPPCVSIHLDTLPKLNPPNLAGKTFSYPPQSQLPPKTISSLPLLTLGTVFFVTYKKKQAEGLEREN